MRQPLLFLKLPPYVMPGYVFLYRYILIVPYGLPLRCGSSYFVAGTSSVSTRAPLLQATFSQWLYSKVTRCIPFVLLFSLQPKGICNESSHKIRNCKVIDTVDNFKIASPNLGRIHTIFFGQLV